MFKNPRDKTQIVHLDRQDYTESISSYLKTYLDACRDPRIYLFFDLKQYIKYLLGFRKRTYPDEITDVSAPAECNGPIEITTTFHSRS